MYAIYMYVINGKPIYVGKTNKDVKSRIWSHEKEDIFKPYKNAKIYYAELKNSAETTIFETLLINNLHPILNVSMEYNNSRYLDFDESVLEWKEYTQGKTKEIYDNQKAITLALKRLKMTPEEREMERAKYTFPHKTHNKNHIYGSGSYCSVTRKGHHYIVYRRMIKGVRKSFYGKTQEEAYEKYKKYVHNIDS